MIGPGQTTSGASHAAWNIRRYRKALVNARIAASRPRASPAWERRQRRERGPETGGRAETEAELETPQLPRRQEIHRSREHPSRPVHKGEACSVTSNAPHHLPAPKRSGGDHRAPQIPHRHHESHGRTEHVANGSPECGNAVAACPCRLEGSGAGSLPHSGAVFTPPF